MILVLFNRSQEGLLSVSFVGIILGLVFFDNVVPIAAKHGVGFTTSSLSVSENGDIVAGDNFLQKGLDRIENFPLSAFGVENGLQVLFSDLTR